jgi:hypothetical protein
LQATGFPFSPARQTWESLIMQTASRGCSMRRN